MISGFYVLVKKCFSKVRKIFLLFKTLKLCFDIQVLNPPGIEFPVCCEIEVQLFPHMDIQLTLISTLICHVWGFFWILCTSGQQTFSTKGLVVSIFRGESLVLSVPSAQCCPCRLRAEDWVWLGSKKLYLWMLRWEFYKTSTHVTKYYSLNNVCNYLKV